MNRREPFRGQSETEGLCSMKKRTTIDAGAIVYEIDAPVRQRGDSPKQRAAKAKATGDAQRLRNQILSARELELRLAVNFPTPGSGLVTFAPISEMMFSRIRTSEILGTFSILHTPFTSSAAGRMATAAFFAPLMVTSPFSADPP